MVITKIHPLSTTPMMTRYDKTKETHTHTQRQGLTQQKIQHQKQKNPVYLVSMNKHAHMNQSTHKKNKT